MTSSSSLIVVVSGGAGRIAYSLLPIICSGHTFGHNVRIHLRLLDVEPCLEKLNGIVMEIYDATFPLVESVIGTCDSSVAFHNADVAILLGGFPRLKGMERRELLSRNIDIMRSQVLALEAVASRDVKVLVVANPANTNCLAALKLATHIPSQNFSCLTRLDHERLIATIVEKVNQTHPGLNIKPPHVRNVCILGNHSTTQVPLAYAAEICVFLGGIPLWEPILKYVNIEWLQNDLISIVQQRGGAILKAQQASSGMSAAVAISRHLKDWLGPAPSSSPSDVFSMGILSDGNPYGIPPGLVFSFPCRRAAGSEPGIVQVDSSFKFDGKYSDFLSETVVELMGERLEAESLIGISLGGHEV